MWNISFFALWIFAFAQGISDSSIIRQQYHTNYNNKFNSLREAPLCLTITHREQLWRLFYQSIGTRIENKYSKSKYLCHLTHHYGNNISPVQMMLFHENLEQFSTWWVCRTRETTTITTTHLLVGSFLYLSVWQNRKCVSSLCIYHSGWRIEKDENFAFNCIIFRLIDDNIHR